MNQMRISDYHDTLPFRIKNIYSQCNEKERYYLRKILEELSATGDSQTYNDIWLSDYNEIPVDIETFITDEMYLGKSTRRGTAVYPFWRQEMKNIFSAGNMFDEIVFTGATRIGKSTTAVTCAIYMLYKLMCLKDPQEYFQKKDVSKFSVLFFNVTLDLAKGVAYREFNDTLKTSPWFADKGHFSKSERDFYYIPDGGKIVIDYGADSSHALGQQVFCLVGDTKVRLADNSILKLSDIANTRVTCKTYNIKTNCEEISCVCSCVPTIQTNETICIELEDGTLIEGSYDHKVLLSDGTYKELQYVTEDDDIMEV